MVQVEEIEILDSLFAKKRKYQLKEKIERLSDGANHDVRSAFNSAIRVLTLEFFTKTTANKYKEHGEFVSTTHESVKLTLK